ncbi:cell division protein FtsX [Prosthecomicrobium sp. N25]|uniref:cell division protein FtsX n=1 Tax=Prosthecomicrobium sp. N25 TaxID=3129254 RepID=UPI0030787EA9
MAEPPGGDPKTREAQGDDPARPAPRVAASAPRPPDPRPAKPAGPPARPADETRTPPAQPRAAAPAPARPPSPAPPSMPQPQARAAGTSARPEVRPRKPSPAPQRSRDPGAPIVPSQSVAGRALIAVVAIMCFLACIAAGVLALVSEAARGWQLDISREVTIQVKPMEGVGMEANLQRALAIARETTGVRAVRLMSERDSAQLLEPWLGAGLDLSGLPLPRLIVLELSDPASADLHGLRSRLDAEVRGALLDDHSIWAARLRTMAGTMVVASSVVLVLVLVAMILSVVFATRAAMAGNRDVIEVLHFVGAEDRFIAREFQRHFLLLGFKGGIVGGLAAMLSFAVADWITRGAPGSALSDQAQAVFGGFSVGLAGYLGAALLVGLVAILTAATSRLTVRSYLGQLD